MPPSSPSCRANLAVPRMGVFEPSADHATRPEADIDLYVAPPTIPNNYALTNLDPAVVEAADKSLSRGGTETIVYSNATPGIYYIGVKSEDQQAAEYAIMGVFSELPFGSRTTTATSFGRHPDVRADPGRVAATAGRRDDRGRSRLQPIKLRRVIVTNIIAHELMTDLLGNLSHGRGFCRPQQPHLRDRSGYGPLCQTWTSYIYDDSDERNVGPNSR